MLYLGRLAVLWRYGKLEAEGSEFSFARRKKNAPKFHYSEVDLFFCRRVCTSAPVEFNEFAPSIMAWAIRLQSLSVGFLGSHPLFYELSGSAGSESENDSSSAFSRRTH